MATQDSNKKIESTASKTGSKSSKTEAQSEKPQTNEETEEQGEEQQVGEETEGQGEEQQTGEETEGQEEGQQTEEQTGNTLLQVLNFLKTSNLINLDMPLKSLFDQVQNIQTDPSSEWGLIGDSGHWALVWQKKHD